MQSAFFLIACFVIFSAAQAVNDRPIIGVYTQPSDSDLQQFGEQFIAASYVKFIEGAGARVVPIRYTINSSEIESLFNSLNGFLLPGGGVDFGTQHQYWTTLSTFYALAIKANANGDYFPMWGTCMGFQELCLLQSQNMSLLSQFNSENYTIPLNFTSAASSSRLFANAPSSVLTTLTTQPVTMNNHMYGVSPASYSAQSELNTFFDVLSTNLDRDGREFLSTIESFDYPIYGSQWHPEKPIYEWNIHEVINHSTDSVAANAYTATFFVTEARKSMHTFPSVEAETEALIYNYQPIYIYNIVNDFEQGYFFNATM
eukprot:Phypoly_transcript_13097.p1 GENE.Phypoly_transcript_13097~~Phypoly_transcript_13097.p1  ORF type:complete len:315 (+),score=38.94 Phypoly_transcript_13097:117-1061(+)